MSAHHFFRCPLDETGENQKRYLRQKYRDIAGQRAPFWKLSVVDGRRMAVSRLHKMRASNALPQMRSFFTSICICQSILEPCPSQRQRHIASSSVMIYLLDNSLPAFYTAHPFGTFLARLEN